MNSGVENKKVGVWLARAANCSVNDKGPAATSAHFVQIHPLPFLCLRMIHVTSQGHGNVPCHGCRATANMQKHVVLEE